MSGTVGIRVQESSGCPSTFIRSCGLEGISRHSARGSHHVADPDIRLRGANLMLLIISCLILRWGIKSIAKLDGGTWPYFPSGSAIASLIGRGNMLPIQLFRSAR